MAGGIGNWVARRAERTPGAIALIDGASGERYDYAQLERRTSARAAGLRERGVRKGDRVALLMNNSTVLLETMFAVARLGAISVPVNYRLSAAEIAYLVDDARPTVFVHDSAWESLAGAALASVTQAPQAVRCDQLPGFGPECPDEVVQGEDTALLMYTSGTTGRPKGAMITHGNLEWNAVNMVTAGKGLTPDDVTLAVAPLFHIGGLALFTLPLLYAGGTVVVHESFAPQQTLELIDRERITVQFMVPAMWAAMSQVPAFDDYELSALRYLLCGGAPCPIPVIDFYKNKGLTFMEGFGMTELSPAAFILDAEFVRSHAGSIGRPFLHVDARIVDDQDEDVAIGEVGELVLRGPNVFAGYWGLPEATAEAMRGGWFHSGDLGRRDADGFVTLVDRKKDMIISGGENVYPIEVEQVLHRHPAVADVAVVGVPDTQWGEKVVAVVVPNEDAELNPGDLITYSRAHIAHFKCPRWVEVVTELPRTATGKLLKRDLRAHYSNMAEAVNR